MKLLKNVLSKCGFNEEQQTTIINLIQKTVVNDIPEFGDHMSALNWLVEVTQKYWLRGEGLERWDVQDNAEQLAERDAIIKMFHSLNLINEIKPSHSHYDYVLMMGALENRVKIRLEHAHSLYANSEYDFDNLVMLGGARPLTAAQEPSIERLLPEKQTEHGMMMCLLEEMKGEHLEDVFFSKAVQEIDTPMQVDITGKTRRPNTKDTIDSWLATAPKPGRVLVISNQPYCSYQHSVARTLLPTEFEVETVGNRSNGQDPIKVHLDSLARIFYTMQPTLEKNYEHEFTAKGKAESKVVLASAFNFFNSTCDDNLHASKNEIRVTVSYGQLADFIYRPSYLCNEDKLQLETDLINLSMALDDDIDTVLDIIAGHQYTPAIDYLVDLDIKIKNTKQANVLNRIYDACSGQLVHVCIYTLKNLNDCIKVIPAHRNNILQQVIERDDIMKRLFTSYPNKSPSEMLDSLNEEYPEHEEQFIAYYREHFYMAPSI